MVRVASNNYNLRMSKLDISKTEVATAKPKDRAEVHKDILFYSSFSLNF